MTSLFVSVLVASFLGSLHCAVMCGAFVTCGVGVDGKGVAALRQLAYHAGRLTGYAAVGLIAGGLGAALEWGGALVGLQRVAMVAAAAALVLFGAAQLLRRRASPPGLMHRLYVGAFKRLAGLAPGVRAGATGMLSTFLPCGWLYAFAIVAAGAGSAPRGAAVMVAFWIGTVPSLVLVSSGARLIAPRFQRYLPTVGAILLVVAGLYGLVARWPVPTLETMRAQSAVETEAGELPEAPVCH